MTRVDRSRLPEPGPSGPASFPAIEKSSLANGLNVWTVRHAQIPVVASLLIVFLLVVGDGPHAISNADLNARPR